MNPRATLEVIEGVDQYLRKKNMERVTDIIGTLITEPLKGDSECSLKV